MPNVVAGNILQFRVWTTDAEQAAVNTFYYTVGTVVAPPVTVQNCVNAFDAAIAALYKGVMTSAATYRGVQGRVINRLPLETENFTISNAGLGTGSATPNPRQATGLTSWKTGFAGPGHRGRTFWPFTPAAADAAPGIPSAAYITAVNDLCLQLFGFISVVVGGSSAAMAMGLRVKASPLLIPITAYEVIEKFATQRRRGSYGRANSSPI